MNKNVSVKMESNHENSDDINRNCPDSEIPGPSQPSEFETKELPLRSKKAGDLRNSLVLQGVTPL